MDKTSNLKLQLNSIEDYEPDFTLKLATFAVIDNGVSHNKGVSGRKQIIDEETLVEAFPTIFNKPVKAKYFKVSEAGEGDDHFGDHEEFLDVDRNGEERVNTDTISIGHFITEGYYDEENEDGVKVVLAKAVLYAEEYPDQIALLQEWLDSGTKINTSCEYLYRNYEVIDGLEVVKSPVIFTAHTILNSEARGDSKVVNGAYSNSMVISMNQKKEWNNVFDKTVNRFKELEKSRNSELEKTEGVNMGKEKMFKKMCELSHDDIRWKLYDALKEVAPATEYEALWISEVYDDNFVYSIYDAEKSEYIHFEVKYTKTDTDVTVDFEGRIEVKRDWVEVSNSLKETAEKLEIALNSIIEKDAEIEKMTNAKVESDKVLNDATKKLVNLNAKVEELSDIEKIYNQEQFDKALNERKELYGAKFKSLNATEKFESDEVQEMINNSIKDETLVASLNAMVIDLISAVPEIIEGNGDDGNVKVLNAKVIENLIPQDSVREKYFNN